MQPVLVHGLAKYHVHARVHPVHQDGHENGQCFVREELHGRGRVFAFWLLQLSASYTQLLHPLHGWWQEHTRHLFKYISLVRRRTHITISRLGTRFLLSSPPSSDAACTACMSPWTGQVPCACQSTPSTPRHHASHDENGQCFVGELHGCDKNLLRKQWAGYMRYSV